MKIKILALTLFFLLKTAQLFAEIYEVNNEKITMLLESSVPLIDIRTEGEWHETGVIKSSHLLTFFDKDGNYDFKKWMFEVEKIADQNEEDAINSFSRESIEMDQAELATKKILAEVETTVSRQEEEKRMLEERLVQEKTNMSLLELEEKHVFEACGLFLKNWGHVSKGRKNEINGMEAVIDALSTPGTNLIQN